MSRFQRVIAFLMLAFLGWTADSWAQTYRLFRRPSAFDPVKAGVPVPDYENILRFLKPGDVLEFTDGTQFTIDHFVASGGTTMIYSVKEQPDAVLRIPKARLGHQEFVDFYVDGYTELAEEGVPVVNVRKSLSHEFALVDRLPEKTLTFAQIAEDVSLPAATRKEMGDALVDFMRKAAGFVSIGDFRPDQIVYDPKSKSWILFDWTKFHKKARAVRDEHFLEEYFFMNYLEPGPNGERFHPLKPEYQ